MALSKEEVLKIAKLSMLEFEEKDIERFQHDLNDILKFVEKLSEVNTEGVEPLAQINDIYNVFRDDKIVKSISNEKALENAPESLEGSFVVPKIVGEN
ncbi:aspartyl/glutamyl-tRNA(Asn/Gln) amidotransferase subunit C [Hypnocyclicus thermotrophus]|uniref:Aspartyl/glutamyl-tRNA(Asn/Gln) amidotransferase subunit C n=1 Tax=Hypnocyclicus thermotrophus TaxID=1627895 RepID=A0AA46I5A7_9FUSO|nr:Asp-tRNA(Asn)/Glu-tRNA(Gln) amidotransferase subunit GatC [Hypnocyclicus thermotrophus]TDT69109.1 aspartyl/glutamyl-tRNA(Asn/Gln) amidotransferase subunit C [Hypnocyclicus thermotrophus]